MSGPPTDGTTTRPDWLARVKTRATDAAMTATNVDERIHAIERLGQHGTMPGYWREPLFLAFTADDIAAQKLCAELDGLLRERDEARQALGGLLAWAERYRGGDQTLGLEEWYVERDRARAVLGSLTEGEQ